MNLVESSLYELTSLLLIPVLALILIALLYAFVALGGFAVELFQRRRGKSPRTLLAQTKTTSTDDLELGIMRRLEGLRIVSRTAPMLGLIATMIPMGPALLALGSGDTSAVGQNLVKAFSSVILALMAASISFVILTVRRRWLLQELRDIEREAECETEKQAATSTEA